VSRTCQPLTESIRIVNDFSRTSRDHKLSEINASTVGKILSWPLLNQYGNKVPGSDLDALRETNQRVDPKDVLFVAGLRVWWNAQP
jgi:hypothetical protein